MILKNLTRSFIFAFKTKNMEVITFETATFKELWNQVELIKQLIQQKEKHFTEQWIDNQELMKLLKISKRTAQNYRDAGVLAFSQIGNKIYYKISDIDLLMKKHYQKAFK
jgi:Helix-turn-helix domain